MYRIRSVQTPFTGTISVSTENPIFRKDLNDVHIQDVMVGISGGSFICEDPLDKHIITHRLGDSVIEHYLISKADDHPVHKRVSYPVLTRILPLRGNAGDGSALVHINGVNEFHRVLNGGFCEPTIVPDHLRCPTMSAITNMIYKLVEANVRRNLIADKRVDYIKFPPVDFRVVEERSFRPKNFDVEGFSEGILESLCKRKLRNGQLDYADVRELCAALLPTAHKSHFADPVFRHLVFANAITPAFFENLFRTENVDYDEKTNVSELVQNRIDNAIIDAHDVAMYPELMELYDFVVTSGYTSVYLEYILDENLLWTPTKRCNALCKYTGENDDTYSIEFIRTLEAILEDSQLIGDIANDLSDCEQFGYQNSAMDVTDIWKLELIVEDAAILITVGLSSGMATIYLDIPTVATISNSLISE